MKLITIYTMTIVLSIALARNFLIANIYATIQSLLQCNIAEKRTKRNLNSGVLVGGVKNGEGWSRS